MNSPSLLADGLALFCLINPLSLLLISYSTLFCLKKSLSLLSDDSLSHLPDEFSISSDRGVISLLPDEFYLSFG
jgi:hypothetical protein